MVTRGTRRGFTLVELLVVIAIIGVLVALLLPAIQAAREAARRNSCINNMKQIGLGIQNHHDVKKRLPLASTSAFANAPGGVGDPTMANDSGAGYSWLVQILPFMEETILYDRISLLSTKFTKSAFDPVLTVSDDPASDHISTTLLTTLRCPSYGGEEFISPKPSVYTVQGEELGVTNYKCLPGTHIQDPLKLPNAGKSTWGNGAIVFPAPMLDFQKRRGLGFGAVRDGTSKTICATESIEETWASWFDGQVTWVLGVPNATAVAPGVDPIQPWDPQAMTPVGTKPADGFIGWDNQLTPGVEVSINYGDDGSGKHGPYLDGSNWSGGENMNWGMSSAHSGDIAIVLFVDGHVNSVAVENLDKNGFLRLITREGGEPALTLE